MRSTLAVLTALVLVAWPWVPAAGRDPSAVYPSEAAFQAAVAPLRQAVQQNPRDPEARYRLGFAYFTVWRQYEVGLVTYGRNYHQLAEAEFRAALAAVPGHLGSLLALYGLLRLRGDWDAAESLLAELSRLMLPRGEVPAVR
ncbi:MAG: tetratricopeptide repeat protein [Armatimonadota bacterium]|nr:tetratricopeptide repeat protein [Armatimonadota bacterium]MDW8155739.1 tetratricopeptide repeat protein [Armatimonadota bacterium]